MKKLILSLFCVLMFANIVFAQEKIAVVDLQKVVNQSAEVSALRKEQTAKLKELNGILTKAQTEIAKENDIKKIVEIQDRYANEFNQKKSNIEKIYSDKISRIEARILSDVKAVAKTKGYDIVLAKSVALYGGDDITQEVAGMAR